MFVICIKRSFEQYIDKHYARWANGCLINCKCHFSSSTTGIHLKQHSTLVSCVSDTLILAPQCADLKFDFFELTPALRLGSVGNFNFYKSPIFCCDFDFFPITVRSPSHYIEFMMKMEEMTAKMGSKKALRKMDKDRRSLRRFKHLYYLYRVQRDTYDEVSFSRLELVFENHNTS